MAHDIHDALFRATFSEPEHAAGELRHLLPAKLAARIDFASLTLIPGTFVDEALARQHTDLLFSARLSGRPAFIYLLFEHFGGMFSSSATSSGPRISSSASSRPSTRTERRRS